MPVVMVSLRLDYFKNCLGYTKVGLWNFCWFAFLWLSPFIFSLDVSRRRKWQPTPVFFPGESQGQGSLVGCRLWGRTESDMTEAT